MVIECEKCKRKFKIDDSRIKPPGSKVRCSKCGHIFYVEKNETFEAPELTEDDRFLEDEQQSQPPSEEQASLQDESLTDESALNFTTNETDDDNEPGDSVFSVEHIDHHDTEDTAIEDKISGMIPETKEPPEPNKTPTGGDNWEEFVSITKTEDNTAEVEHSIETDSEDLSIDQSALNDFDWENINIGDDKASQVPQTESTDLFADEQEVPTESDVDVSDVTETTEQIPDETTTSPVQPQEFTAPPATEEFNEPVLTLDTEVDRSTGPVSSPMPSYEQPPDSKPPPSYRRPSKRKNVRILRKIAYTIVAICILTVLTVATFIILTNLGIIHKHKAQEISATIKAMLPFTFEEQSKRHVIITQHSGGWLDTKNGHIYVITGAVKNRSSAPVNYIKIKSEFVSAGDILFEDHIYAGNTFTKKELQNSSFEQLLRKLKKKNGDVNFDNLSKLAGLNLDIQPSESIPFFAIFPSKSIIRGLKYNLNVLDYEGEPQNE